MLSTQVTEAAHRAARALSTFMAKVKGGATELTAAARESAKGENKTTALLEAMGANRTQHKALHRQKDSGKKVDGKTFDKLSLQRVDQEADLESRNSIDAENEANLTAASVAEPLRLAEAAEAKAAEAQKLKIKYIAEMFGSFARAATCHRRYTQMEAFTMNKPHSGQVFGRMMGGLAGQFREEFGPILEKELKAIGLTWNELYQDFYNLLAESKALQAAALEPPQEIAAEALAAARAELAGEAAKK